ncbi:MAG TPA: hypothetical protein VL961_06895 [Acidimicrobiales bacterium]|nr:hypothetical protein [Acidimicrobiales bacterium]
MGLDRLLPARVRTLDGRGESLPWPHGSVEAVLGLGVVGDVTVDADHRADVFRTRTLG